MGTSRRPLLRFTVPVAALLGAGLALLLPGNTRLWDTLGRALPAPPDPRVVVVGIDDASLRDYGRLRGWPRELYAQALRTLEAAGARATGLDVPLPDLTSPDFRLADIFSRPNVVLAGGPGDRALNVEPSGVVRTFQTAIPEPDGKLCPGFARQLAVAAGEVVPLDPAPRLLRQTRSGQATFSFRDVVNGNVRFGDLRGRVVVIGVTAPGLPGTMLRDVTGQVTPHVLLQARAVASLLAPPFLPLPHWLTVLLSAGVAVLAVLAGRLWGFALALLALALAAPLWLVNVLFPGVTLSLAAILGTALVGGERWWALRHLGTRDPLTGLGNRLAFTRAVEHRWPGRQDQPIGLLLLDFGGLRRVGDAYGHAAGAEALREVAGHLVTHKRRGDLIFRWGPAEFAVLLDHLDAGGLPQIAEQAQRALDDLTYRDLPLRASLGAAVTGPGIRTPGELIEAASRSRYRLKYQREQGE